MKERIEPAICPICNREYDGQEVDVVPVIDGIGALKTKCLGCGNTYTFKAEQKGEAMKKCADCIHERYARVAFCRMAKVILPCASYKRKWWKVWRKK